MEFYGIEFLFPRRYDTPHNGVYLTYAPLRRSPANKARMYYFSIRTKILQRNLVKLSNPTRVLPKFLASCRSAEPKKESNSINLDFYKCLNFLLSILCSTRFLKNPIPSEQADNLILTTILSALRRRLTPTDYTLEN